MSINNSNSISRGRFYLCLFLSLQVLEPAYVSARETTCTKVKSIHTGVNSFEYQLKYSYFGNTITYCSDMDSRPVDGTLIFHTIQIETETKSSFTIHLPTTIKLKSVPEFCATPNYLLLQEDEQLNIFCFKQIDSKNFEFSGRVRLPERAAAFRFEPMSNSKFLLKDFYNHHPLDNVENITLAIFNAESNTIVKVIHPETPCIAFSHLQNEYFAMNENRIAMSEACGNKIHIFDSSLNEIDIIHIPEIGGIQNAKPIPFESDPSKVNPKLLIEDLKKYSNKTARIESIFYGQGNKLFISIVPEKQFENARYLLTYNELGKQFTQPQTIRFTEQFCNHIALPVWMDYHLSIHNEKIIIGSDDGYLQDSCLPNEIYQKQRNTYYENNNGEYIFHYYRIDQ